MFKPIASVAIGQAVVHPLTLEQLLAACDEALVSGRSMVILNVNAHAVVLAEVHLAFRQALRRADWVFCDGMGVWLAARWLGTPLPARFTPPDWIHQLGEICLAHGRSMFLLGGTEQSVVRAADALRRRVPGLSVRAHHGYFDKTGAENEKVIAQVNAVHPGALLVGFGMPLQELWIIENRARLNATIFLAVGGLFDYLGGMKPRCPRWLTDHGFEWLCRLFTEPRRLWRRYALGLPHFAWIVLRQKIRSQKAEAT